MELQYLGGNGLKIKTKDAIIVVDGHLKAFGLKDAFSPETINLHTISNKHDAQEPSRISIDSPGEYEIAGVSITGVGANTINSNEPDAVIYRIIEGDIKLAVIGHIKPSLSDEQLADIDGVDILFLPVGGNGKETLDAVGATEIIKKIEPKIVIPAYWQDKSVRYPGEVASLGEALEKMGLQVDDSMPKYRPKTTDFGENVKTIQLTI